MTAPFGKTVTVVKSHWMKALRLTSIVLVGLFAQGSLAQTTTTLNFDSLGEDAPITSQYSAQGVSFSGANSVTAATLGFTAKSGAKVAYAPSGLITLSVSIADVKTVSAYVTGPVNVGIFAYDSADNLLGQALLPANAPANTLLSVTSSGAPIAKVAIHDGGASFAIDDLSFTTAAPVPQVPSCRAASESLYNMISALPASAYIRAKTATLDRIRLLAEVVAYELLRTSNKATQKTLQAALVVIQADVVLSIQPASRTAIVSQLTLMNSYVKNNSCQ
ncbi:MAG: hypothetical protein JSU04_18945 [Bdellovibrionales bacterium]|nr:hypothetical protein [Bdellovibrionales bacterium]